MKVFFALLLTTAFAVSLAACSVPAPAASPLATAAISAAAGAAAPLIAPADAKARLEKEQGIVVVDVRTAEEYAEGHLKGALLLPVDDIDAFAPQKLTDKDAILFVYCRSGRRSAIAGAQLIQMGYTHVFDLGGIQSWPYEVVKD